MSTIFLGGTPGNDQLTGGDGDDYIFGNGGSDTMSGGNGNDQIYSTNIDRAGAPDLLGDVMNGGAGNDIMFGDDGNDRLNGNGGNDQLNGKGGNDWLNGGDGNDTIDGGAGNDMAIYAGARDTYTVGRPAGGMPATVVAADQSSDALVSVERLQFADTAVAYDIDGNAGKAFRLYQAIFDRPSDTAGLGYWINVSDNGAAWTDIAGGFTHSAEFDAMYGINSTNTQFLTALYHNALHRDLDQGGLDYWLDVMANHGQTREMVLLGFSESAENKAQVIGSIQNGIEFTVFTG
jgi:serralysin